MSAHSTNDAIIKLTQCRSSKYETVAEVTYMCMLG
jgi:hypothetical protein